MTDLLAKLLLNLASEIAHKECGWTQVMWYNFRWFQPHATWVTCSVLDVEVNFQIYKSIQLLVRLHGWVVILESTGEAVATGKVNKPVRLG